MSPLSSPRQSQNPSFPLLPQRSSQSQSHLFHAPPSSRKRPTLFLFGLSLVCILVFVSVREHSSDGARWASLQRVKETLVGTGTGEGDLPVAIQHAVELPQLEQSVHVEEPAESLWGEVEPVEQAPQDAPAESATPGEVLPECNRTMMYNFGRLHGFGSEVAILVRAAAVARHYGYTLLLDSSEWNYGSWTSYFEPLSISCTPPAEDKVRRKPVITTPAEVAAHSIAPSWTRSHHVEWHRDLDGLDGLVLNLWSDHRDVDALHAADAARAATVPLSPEATVPEAFWEVFGVEAAILRELWRPNEELRTLMGALEDRLDVAQDGDEKRGLFQAAEDVTIAMHVRLGDKYLEVDKIGPAGKDHASPHKSAGPGLHSDAISTYLTAARESVSRVLASNADDEGEDRKRAEVAWKGRSTLVIMSDDPDAWKDFERDERAKDFRVVGTTASEDKRARAVAKNSEQPSKDGGGFNETAFNRLPLAERIALTRTFVRDVTVLSTRTDALVMSASSNVGRLMTLLCGEEKALRLGRVRSVDTRWFPTARYQ